MASAAVLTAFATKLATWSSASTYPAMTINEAASSPAAAFTEIECPISTEEREEMGPPPVTYRETGVIALTLHVRKLDVVPVEVPYYFDYIKG
jgi:hypothetical protein